MARKHVLFFLGEVLLMLVNPGNCGLTILAHSSSGLFSDGVGEVQQPDFIVFEKWPSLDSYSQRIGSMPCTTTVPGNMFPILVYVSVMLFAAKLLYDGSEILVEVVSPRITGGVFLPLLGSLLDAIISIASRLCGNTETVQNDQVSAGTGLLIGSTAMLLMLLGGSCIIVGLSPFYFEKKTSLCKPQAYYAENCKKLKCCSLGRLLTADGEPDVEVIRRLFEVIGENLDQLLSASVLRALIIGIQINDKDSDIDDAVGKVVIDFDKHGDSKINMDAFVKGISSWLTKAKHSAICFRGNDLKTRIFVDDDSNMATNKEHGLLGFQSDEVAKKENPKWSASKAVLMLLLGSLIAATFSDPLVSCVGNFSTATNIPSFLVSFAILPFAISSEAMSTQMFASQKKLRIASLTLSKIYGVVNMNNLLCLSVFLGLLYFRQLQWNFTSEVLIILIIWSFLPKHVR